MNRKILRACLAGLLPIPFRLLLAGAIAASTASAQVPDRSGRRPADKPQGTALVAPVPLHAPTLVTTPALRFIGDTETFSSPRPPLSRAAPATSAVHVNTGKLVFIGAAGNP
jgi:hypothetical protein